ncbi:MAG: hypothetical protein GC154_18285 [bacterium]|nr:hypothetical protein [bacterium]
MTNEEKVDLYEFEIGRFQDLLKENPEYAYQRYGLSVFYSLPPEQTFTLRKGMGWKSKDALDFYNEGAVEALEGRLKEAMKMFEKAESMGCEQPELFYNIAAVHQEEGRAKEAKAYLQKYIDAVEKLDFIPKSLQDELDEAREELEELSA